MLVPGGKALVLNLSNSAFQMMYLTNEANRVVVQEKIDQTSASIPNHPTQEQISKTFKDFHEVVGLSFAYDQNGSLFQIKDMNQLANGCTIVRKSFMTTFPGIYYDEKFLADQTTAAGLFIGQIENVFTEERRIVHNIQNPEMTCSKDIVEHSYCLLYHLSKP